MPHRNIDIKFNMETKGYINNNLRKRGVFRDEIEKDQ